MKRRSLLTRRRGWRRSGATPARGTYCSSCRAARVLVAAAVRLPGDADPRPDTECLVEQALARLPTAPCRILDLGTGTGAIATALASERPDCEVTAVDVMPDAVALALRNAEHLSIANVTISQSDWFSALAGQRFATIVSNPLYRRRRPASRRRRCAL